MVDSQSSADRRDTARIEAFSDGVFAIAITLLVLDLKVPHDIGSDPTLFRALARQWPSYLAFAGSFATILIMWINHHRMFSLISRADDRLLAWNGLLLMGVTLVPFPTSLVAEYLGHPGERAAAVVYNGEFVVIAVLFNLLWRSAAEDCRLIDRHADARDVAAITGAYRFGPLIYLAAFAIGLVNVPLSLTIDLALAGFFARSPTPPAPSP
jgi:uncharacterized membrane protein